MANFAKEDLQKELGNLQGSVLYNALQAAKVTAAKGYPSFFYPLHSSFWITNMSLFFPSVFLLLLLLSSVISPQQLQDHTLPDPKDPRWDHLRDVIGLKKKIGEAIELPDLSGARKGLPKEMTKEKTKNIVLTHQRYKLLEEFAKAVNLGQKDVDNADPQSGMILSGLNGVGKTVESYLITCIAYVNDSLLIYIVRIVLFLFFFSHCFCCF